MGLHDLIKDELDHRDTVLIHGTSVEGTLGLLRDGVLNRDTFDGRDYIHEGYLFFFPNAEMMKGHELYRPFAGLSWEESLAFGQYAAEEVAFRHHVLSLFGRYPASYSLSDIEETRLSLVNHLDIPSTLTGSLELFYLDMEKLGRSRQESESLLVESAQRSGVLLGLGGEAFELPLEEGKDDPDLEVCAYLPGGLSIRYVNAIVPLGTYEREQLRHFSQKK